MCGCHGPKGFSKISRKSSLAQQSPITFSLTTLACDIHVEAMHSEVAKAGVSHVQRRSGMMETVKSLILAKAARSQAAALDCMSDVRGRGTIQNMVFMSLTEALRAAVAKAGMVDVLVWSGLIQKFN
eukprot:TRINITY_DN76698_c0_g1_i1.p2 TRINITY_DN76698_c0_g1~~TRINITY_DN76698_c0_g1_i1.p2  ORF type:complete len:127 (+),score=16.27 TRINITY_DN76698_c0_g1_i1:316-696(+)